MDQSETSKKIRKSKSFRTYSQQIDALEDKGLLVEDRAAALNTLRHISYFALISGYKEPFREDGRQGKYRAGVRFEDIVDLYRFDVRLSGAFLRHLLAVERHLKSLYGYHFARQFGDSADAYRDPRNYTGNERGIAQLVHTLENHAENYSEQHEYIDHYRRNYQNVPIWVLMHAVTFGELAHMFEYAVPELRDVICTEIPGMRSRDLPHVLHFLLRVRNICAHAEPLYNLRTKEKLPVSGLHRSLGLAGADGSCTVGRNDVFAALLAIRGLVPDQNARELVAEIDMLMELMFSKPTWVKRGQLTDIMGFPDNWKEAADVPLKMPAAPVKETAEA